MVAYNVFFCQLQSKRELFFKNEASPAPALVNSVNSGSSAAAPSAALAGGLSVVTKQEFPPRNPVDTTSNRVHQHANGNGNIEDNKEREMKEKMKLEKPENKKKKELDGYVGFANLPNQVYRKAVKRGFDFTLMVVGKSDVFSGSLIMECTKIIIF